METSTVTEVWMLLCFPRSKTLLVIVAQQPVQQVDCLVGDVPLILRGSEARPRLLRVAEVARQYFSSGKLREVDKRCSLAEELIILRIERDIVLVYVLIQSLSAQHFGDLHELIIVIVSVEEWLLTEDLRGI